LGIEPTHSTASISRDKGINTLEQFFGVDVALFLARHKNQADLIIGNNVLAHVPNINDFVEATRILLKPDGTVTMEFTHLQKLIEHKQFDTIYHEHFSYFSLYTVNEIFKKHGLTIYDVEEIDMQGGELRIYAGHTDSLSFQISMNVYDVLERESNISLDFFGIRASNIRFEFMYFLNSAIHNERKIIAYGAAAKGNTFLNYCGIDCDSIFAVIDDSGLKQGKYLPGSHIPVMDESIIGLSKPDYILILAWNYKDSIMKRLEYVKEWGCKFVVAIPELRIY
jgi:hypothetical protein